MNPDEVVTALTSMADQLMERCSDCVGTIPEELHAIADWVEHEFVEIEVPEEEP